MTITLFGVLQAALQPRSMLHRVLDALLSGVHALINIWNSP